MKYTHRQKYIRISPLKVRRLVYAIRKDAPQVAVEKLALVRKSSSEVLRKTILAAVANAKNKGADEKALRFSSIQVGEGPRLKRGIAVSRGRWHPIVKKMAHLTVVLETKNTKVAKADPKKAVKSTKKVEAKVKKGAK